jgi:two-component system, LytTR family, sensor kinase
MDLSRSEEWLVVKIENSRENGTAHNGRERDGLLPETSGIGLANVRRRLEILYAEQYEFKTLSEEHSFLAVLKIKNQRHARKLSHSG